jgi:hypothetical protein
MYLLYPTRQASLFQQHHFQGLEMHLLHDKLASDRFRVSSSTPMVVAFNFACDCPPEDGSGADTVSIGAAIFSSLMCQVEHVSEANLQFIYNDSLPD